MAGKRKERCFSYWERRKLAIRDALGGGEYEGNNEAVAGKKKQRKERKEEGEEEEERKRGVRVLRRW